VGYTTVLSIDHRVCVSHVAQAALLANTVLSGVSFSLDVSHVPTFWERALSASKKKKVGSMMTAAIVAKGSSSLTCETWSSVLAYSRAHR
jgi:hypothetical protein